MRTSNWRIVPQVVIKNAAPWMHAHIKKMSNWLIQFRAGDKKHEQHLVAGTQKAINRFLFLRKTWATESEIKFRNVRK